MEQYTHLKELYQEIESKRADLFDVEKSSLIRHKIAREALEGDSRLTRKEELEHLAHSVRIEHPFAHIHSLGLSKREQRKLKKEVKVLTNRLREIWLSSKMIFPYYGDLSEEYITEIARRIDPTKNYGGFRKEDVLIGSEYPPPPNELQREMNLFLYENKNINSPLEQAFHAHFHIARIHPYRDGNGRTSRMVQNLMLDNFNYPVVVIKEGERQLYYDLLDCARNSFKLRKDKTEELSTEEKLFYEFLGTKVNMGFDRILHND